MSLEDNLSSYYDYAEIRYAVVITDQVPHLVFASIHLLPKDEAMPYSSDAVKINVKKDTYWARKFIVKAKDALAWYRSNYELYKPKPIAESCLLPFSDDLQNPPPINVDLYDETEWGDFGIPLNHEDFFCENKIDSAPYLGDSTASIRVHRRFGDNSKIRDLIKDEKAKLFLNQFFYFNLDKYYEYIGGMVLILPDPVISYIEDHKVKNHDSDANIEENRLILHPYPSQNLDKIKLITFNIYLGHLYNLQIHNNIDATGIVFIPHKRSRQEQGYFLLHYDLGCIRFFPPTGFIASIHFFSSMLGANVNIKAPLTDKKNAPTYTYNQSICNMRKESIIGEDTSDEHFNNINKAMSTRNKESKRQSSGQIWFDRSTEKARENALNLFHQILNKARERVIFFDPYFGANQVGQFALKSAIKGIDTKIVTSRLAFSQEKDNALKMQENIENLRNKINNINLPLSCHILDSKKPPLHDRFLVIDNNVWFIGHSFNQIGLQNCFMLKVPVPEDVLDKLDEIMNETISLEQFISDSKLSLS